MIFVEHQDNGADLTTAQLERAMRSEMCCRDIFRQGHRVVQLNLVRHSYTIKQVTTSTVSFFHLAMAKAWLGSVFCARFQDSQIIQKVFNFLADHGKLLTFLSHRPADFAFECLSHTRFCDVRFYG